MAMAMREEAGKLVAAWRRHGSELGFGMGIAQGYAYLRYYRIPHGAALLFVSIVVAMTLPPPAPTRALSGW
jgi:hypothetical protein